MVSFEKEGLVIRLSGVDVEGWLELMSQLSVALMLASTADNDIMPEGGLWRVANLIEDLLPDWETARKMEQ
ncbi:MAG: hypothetical protein J6M31_01715 [Bacteroidales bacterium]|nr:hypothetical protein [Bacteroidales bacterium]MBP3202305.1 hypothetical protein [Bacteroidales bacterium]